MQRSILATSARTHRILEAIPLLPLTFVLALVLGVAVTTATPTSASAAIAQRGSAMTATTTTLTLTISKRLDVVSGDVMLAHVFQYGQSTTDPLLTGWNQVSSTAWTGGGNNRRLAVSYRKADGTEGGNLAFGLGTGTSSAIGGIVAFSGVNTSGPLDVIGAYTLSGPAGTVSAPAAVGCPKEAAALQTRSRSTTMMTIGRKITDAFIYDCPPSSCCGHPNIRSSQMPRGECQITQLEMEVEDCFLLILRPLWAVLP